MKPTRREVLQLASGLAVVGAFRGCGDNASPDTKHAATAIFDPDPESFLVSVWTRLIVDSAAIEVRTSGVLMFETSVPLANGFGATAIRGLAPDTRYEVTIVIDRLRIGPHQVRTAPREDDPRPVKLAVSADADPSPEFESGLFDALIAEDPELYISIGDFPYTDNGPPAMTIDTYRERHVELRIHPPVRRLHEAVAMYAIYDDHEFRNNWDAHFVQTEPDRYAAAMRVWDEFFPLRAKVGEIRYRKWRWGAHVECFLLDCRRFRSADAAIDDASKTMLGAAQKQWLIDGVTKSTATFKLIFTSVPLDFGVGNDHWATFATERDAIFTALIGTRGVFFISGDQHWFASHRHRLGIREMQIGPLARGLGTPGPMLPGVIARFVRFNAGLIEIEGDRLTFSGLGDDGTRFYTETVTAADLTPTA
jgi:phosphodiesterase/alkaline phosphatase D-like protein